MRSCLDPVGNCNETFLDEYHWERMAKNAQIKKNPSNKIGKWDWEWIISPLKKDHYILLIKLINVGVELCKFEITWKDTYRAQSFSSSMADLRQDINRVSTFSSCLNGTFPWRNWYINPNEKSNKYKSSLLS